MRIHISNADPSKVFIIYNDATVDQLIFISMLQNKWSSNQQKNQVKRSPAVAILLVASCLSEDHHGFMNKYLRGRKERNEQDQSINTSISGFDVVLDTFMDPPLVIERPDEMDLYNVDPTKKIDPWTVSLPDGIENGAEWCPNGLKAK